MFSRLPCPVHLYYVDMLKCTISTCLSNACHNCRNEINFNYVAWIKYFDNEIDLLIKILFSHGHAINKHYFSTFNIKKIMKKSGRNFQTIPILLWVSLLLWSYYWAFCFNPFSFVHVSKAALQQIILAHHNTPMLMWEFSIWFVSSFHFF